MNNSPFKIVFERWVGYYDLLVIIKCELQRDIELDIRQKAFASETSQQKAVHNYDCMNKQCSYPPLAILWNRDEARISHLSLHAAFSVHISQQNNDTYGMISNDIMEIPSVPILWWHRLPKYDQIIGTGAACWNAFRILRRNTRRGSALTTQQRKRAIPEVILRK